MYIVIFLLLGSVFCGFALRMSAGAQTRLVLIAAVAATVTYVVWQGAM